MKQKFKWQDISMEMEKLRIKYYTPKKWERDFFLDSTLCVNREIMFEYAVKMMKEWRK